MKKCINCEYSRYTKVPNSIACGYVFTHNQLDHQKTMRDLNLNTLNTGWGYMKRRPDSESNTLGGGIMTNDVALFSRDFCCKYYKLKD